MRTETRVFSDSNEEKKIFSENIESILSDDFKPASVENSKVAKVDVGSDNTITVTVPHLDGAGAPQTVFKGSQRPYNKEYVLIFDKNTGDITLEKLTANIQVKKTRYVYCILVYIMSVKISSSFNVPFAERSLNDMVMVTLYLSRSKEALRMAGHMAEPKLSAERRKNLCFSCIPNRVRNRHHHTIKEVHPVHLLISMF